MDNRIFNVNGSGLEALKAAIHLAIIHEGRTETKNQINAWMIMPEKGLVFFSYGAPKGSNQFITAISSAQAAEMAFNWLQDPDKMKEIYDKLSWEGWDDNLDHDGNNSRGWRVYVEEWGHIGNHYGTVCAIRPTYLWHGK